MSTNVLADPSAFIFMQKSILKIKVQGSTGKLVPVTKQLHVKSRKKDRLENLKSDTHNRTFIEELRKRTRELCSD
jgi:hypothetical protein